MEAWVDPDIHLPFNSAPIGRLCVVLYSLVLRAGGQFSEEPCSFPVDGVRFTDDLCSIVSHGVTLPTAH